MFNIKNFSAYLFVLISLFVTSQVNAYPDDFEEEEYSIMEEGEDNGFIGYDDIIIGISLGGLAIILIIYVSPRQETQETSKNSSTTTVTKKNKTDFSTTSPFVRPKYQSTDVTIDLRQDGYIRTPHLVEQNDNKEEKNKTVIFQTKRSITPSQEGSPETIGSKEDYKALIGYNVSTPGNYKLCHDSSCQNHFRFDSNATYFLHTENSTGKWNKKAINFNQHGQAIYKFHIPTIYYITDASGERITEEKTHEHKIVPEYEQYCQNNMGEVTIQSNIGRKIIIDNIDANDTTQSLKEKIQDKEGIPPEQQRLYFEHIELKDGNILLSQQGICKGAVIMLMLRLRGGENKRKIPSPNFVSNVNKSIENYCLEKDLSIRTYNLDISYERKTHFTAIDKNGKNGNIVDIDENEVAHLSKGFYKYCDGYIGSCTCQNGHSIKGFFTVQAPGNSKEKEINNIGKNQSAWENLCACPENKAGGLYHIHWEDSKEGKQRKTLKVVMIPSINLEEARQDRNFEDLDKWIEENKQNTVDGVTLEIEEFRGEQESTFKKIKLPSGLSPATITAYIWRHYYREDRLNQKRQSPLQIDAMESVSFYDKNKTVRSGTIKVYAWANQFYRSEVRASGANNIYIR